MANLSVTAAEPRRREALKGGAIAGIIGGIVIALFMMIVGAVQGQNLWIGMKVAAYPFLGERVMTPGFDAGAVLLGLVCHFAVSIGWGALFAVSAYGFSRSATVWFGALWGIVVWIGMFYIVLPIVGAGAVARGAPIGTAIVEHLIFGLAVGVGFLPYQRTFTRSRPSLRRRAVPAGGFPIP